MVHHRKVVRKKTYERSDKWLSIPLFMGRPIWLYTMFLRSSGTHSPNWFAGIPPRPSSPFPCMRLLLNSFSPPSSSYFASSLCFHLILIILSVSLLYSLCREVETVLCDIPYLGYSCVDFGFRQFYFYFYVLTLTFLIIVHHPLT